MRKLLFPLLALLIFSACKKETAEQSFKEKIASTAAKSTNGKLDVCHYDATSDTWRTINISINALPAHLAHGDVRLDDQDGDGYVPTNSCGYTGIKGMGDCNDTNASINPGVTEICGDSIDNNCNGQVDENCFPTVTICNQVWMLKNLDVSKYRNGDEILHPTNYTEWQQAYDAGVGAWCYWKNDTSNNAIYGKLYNWYAVTDPRGISPQGWHIPTKTEFETLVSCVGNFAGGKLKSTSLWVSPNSGATNSSGWSGLPGGVMLDGRDISCSPPPYTNCVGFWWSSTSGPDDDYYSVDSSSAFALGLEAQSPFTNENFQGKRVCFSVRCLRD